MFCNLSKEMFFKSLGMLKQNWAADVYCIVLASIITTNTVSLSFHLCSFVLYTSS